MRQPLRWAAAILFAGTLVFVPAKGRVHAAGPTLSTSGTHFTINGNQKFLLLVSYFDALDVPESHLARDFAQFQAWQIDGVRIFPNWLTSLGDPSYFAGDTVIDESGQTRPGPLANLAQFVSTASAYGLVVDVTFGADTIGPADQPSPPNGSTISYDNYKNGVTAVISYLSAHGYSNVMYDLQNEHTRLGNGPQNINFSSTQLADIVAAAKSVAAGQPVFVSTESISASAAGTEAFNAVETVVAYHEPRNNNWWLDTPGIVSDAISASGGKPVYLQEPARMGRPPSCCSVSDFQSAYSAAQTYGAAAWTLHTGATFYMNNTDYLNQLSCTELEFLSTVRAGGTGVSLEWGQQLNPGQSCTSPNGQYTLTYQTDGNLVLYGPGGALWWTGTNGTCPGFAPMQSDGNFVVYDCTGQPVWNSGTWGNPGAYLTVQDDSNLVVYASNGQPLWWRWQ
jgi:hypothetical protein